MRIPNMVGRARDMFNWLKQLIWDLKPSNTKKTQEFVDGAAEMTIKFDEVIAQMKEPPLSKADILADIVPTNIIHAYAYPDIDQPLLQACDGKFEACYIIFHSFYVGDEDLSDSDFVQKAQPIKWQSIVEQTELADVKQLYIGLLDHHRAQQNASGEFKYANMLLEYGKTLSDFHLPDEGEFDEFNRAKYMSILQAINSDSFIFIPEMPHDAVPSADWDTRPLPLLDMQSFNFWQFIEKSTIVQFAALDAHNLPCVGSVTDIDRELMFTVEWDSSFTLMYGARDELEAIVEANEFEGFFADEKTMHAWYM